MMSFSMELLSIRLRRNGLVRWHSMADQVAEHLEIMAVEIS